jgi:hypothetical protein
LSLALLALAGSAHAATKPRVTVITDSVGDVLLWDGFANQILSQGFDLDVEPVICRRLATPGCQYDPPPPSALDTIEALGSKLGKLVVIDVGYNDSPQEIADGIDPVMRALVANGVGHVIWPTYVERIPAWHASNVALIAAAKRWPQLVVADWNTVAIAHDEWFVDAAHMKSDGGRALAGFLHAFLVYACGGGCAPPPPVFCGLARTVNGFDYVRATGVGCPAALGITVSIERNVRGPWQCARRVGGDVELACTFGTEDIDLLERSPVAPRVRNGMVTLANWSFRLEGAFLQARNRTTWRSLGHAPWCIPDAPQEVLVALRLRPVTPDAGCFALPRR